MNFLPNLFALILVLTSVQLNGQCHGTPPLSFTFESTESRCESNGTITLHITGGTPFTDNNGNPIYSNTITAPIVLPVGGQSDSLFSALAADTYTMEVADANGCTVTQQISVPGTHMQLELTPTFGPAICDGSIGGWICGTPSEGRPWPPGYYQYQLFDGSTNPPTPITPIGLDSCFTNLAAGDYEIRSYDSCNNFQTRDLTIEIKTYASAYFYNTQWKLHSCDSSMFSFSPYDSPSQGPWGEYPYQWEIIEAGPDVIELLGLTGQFDNANDYDTLFYTPLLTADRIKFQVTDACGRTATRSPTFENLDINTNGGFVCGEGGTLQVTGLNKLYCDTFIYEIISGPAGFPLPPPQNTDNWNGLPNGNYCVKVTDCCGNTDTKCEAVFGLIWTMQIDTNFIQSCTPGWVGFDVPYIRNGGAAPTGIETIVTSAPAGYPNPLPDTLPSYRKDISGPPGTYCITMYDDCSRRDSACIDIYRPLVYDTDIEIIPGCITGNQVNLTANGNGINRFTFRQLTPVFNVIATNATQVNWNNLTSGTYSVEWYNAYTTCYVKIDTFVIEEYLDPGIFGAWGIECSNGAGLISVQGSGGRLPYTYELFQGPVIRPLQSTPEFPGLPVGTYDVRLNDACNNSSVVTVAIEPFAPVIQGYGGAYCVGDTAFLYVDYFSLANYSWSGPNGAISDTSLIIIPDITLADAGTYTIDIDVKNPDQSACVAQTLTIEILVRDCSCAPGDFIVQNIDCYSADNGMITANMISNAGGPFTYQWNTGDNKQTINDLSPGIYMVTITDAGGCITTGDTTIISPPLMEVLASIDPVSCQSTSDGAASVMASGGTPGYTYQWGPATGGQTTPAVTGLTPGIYKVTVMDNNGCSYRSSFLVNMKNCAPCELAENGLLDICLEIQNNPSPALETADCDDGGIDNQTECIAGGDPLDPADDCAVAVSTLTDICILIGGDPTHPLAMQDCDDGGVPNLVECNSNGDPLSPSDDCAIAIVGNLNICQLINFDLNHPLANSDCDQGGIDNWTECQNAGNPSDPSDDCLVVIDEQINLCTLLASEPTNPLASSDCDGDGVTNTSECTDTTDPLDPCDFTDTSIMLPVTADQSGCENLCPDLTPTTTILPGNIAGASVVGVAVEITELNGVNTDGTGVLIRMPSDPRLTFIWDPFLTTIALVPVNNSNWNYLGDNGVVHTFQYIGNSTTILGGTTEAFGFESVYDPQNTDGQTTITASIVPFGGGECNFLNNTDSERLVYFQ